jgi:hypothetical protein
MGNYIISIYSIYIYRKQITQKFVYPYLYYQHALLTSALDYLYTVDYNKTVHSSTTTLF